MSDKDVEESQRAKVNGGLEAAIKAAREKRRVHAPYFTDLLDMMVVHHELSETGCESRMQEDFPEFHAYLQVRGMLRTNVGWESEARDYLAASLWDRGERGLAYLEVRDTLARFRKRFDLAVAATNLRQGQNVDAYRPDPFAIFYEFAHKNTLKGLKTSMGGAVSYTAGRTAFAIRRYVEDGDLKRAQSLAKNIKEPGQKFYKISHAWIGVGMLWNDQQDEAMQYVEKHRANDNNKVQGLFAYFVARDGFEGEDPDVLADELLYERRWPEVPVHFGLSARLAKQGKIRAGRSRARTNLREGGNHARSFADIMPYVMNHEGGEAGRELMRWLEGNVGRSELQRCYGFIEMMRSGRVTNIHPLRVSEIKPYLCFD